MSMLLRVVNNNEFPFYDQPHRSWMSRGRDRNMYGYGHSVYEYGDPYASTAAAIPYFVQAPAVAFKKPQQQVYMSRQRMPSTLASEMDLFDALEKALMSDSMYGTEAAATLGSNRNKRRRSQVNRGTSAKEKSVVAAGCGIAPVPTPVEQIEDARVMETASTFVMQWKLPGTVSVESMEVTIEAEKFLVVQRKVGDKIVWRRKYGIPESVEVSKIDTMYRDGVLSITLPKHQAIAMRKLSIVSEEANINTNTNDNDNGPTATATSTTTAATAFVERAVEEEEEDAKSEHSSVSEQSHGSTQSHGSAASNSSAVSAMSSVSSSASSKRMMVSEDVYIEDVEEDEEEAGGDGEEYEVVMTAAH